jgi:hypothetical protein
VHLILHGEWLRIGASGSGSIFVLDLTSTSPKGDREARVVIDEKLDAPLRLLGRSRRRFLRSRAKEATSAALFLQGRKKGDVH